MEVPQIKNEPQSPSGFLFKGMPLFFSVISKNTLQWLSQSQKEVAELSKLIFSKLLGLNQGGSQLLALTGSFNASMENFSFNVDKTMDGVLTYQVSSV